MKKPRQATDPDVESKSAFAARVDLSPARISQFIAKGMPLTSDGKVPVAAALGWLRAEVRPNGGRPLGGGGANGDPDLEAAKIRLTIAQAERAELELAARRGELVPAPEARKAVRAFATVAREAWLNAAARHGADLAAEIGADPRDVIPALDAMIRLVMNQIADTPFPKFGDQSE